MQFAKFHLQVKFRGVIVGDFYADMLVEDKVLSRIKSRQPNTFRT